MKYTPYSFPIFAWMKFGKFCGFWLLTIFLSCQSKDGDFTIFTEEEDLALGRKVAEQIAADPEMFPVLNNAEYSGLYRQLENIELKLLDSDAILYRDEFPWQLKVIDNDSICNAFSTPGGFIYVYTGLLHYVESVDELAGIMAHEIAHADRRHSTDQMTKKYGLKAIASLITGGDSQILTNLGINLLGLRFSRSDESEADAYAIQYLNSTDYDPMAFADFFKRMEARGEGDDQLQFLSTHPNPENRIQKIEKLWKESGSKKGIDHSEEFRELLNNLP